jgi:hypothetical protein
MLNNTSTPSLSLDRPVFQKISRLLIKNPHPAKTDTKDDVSITYRIQGRQLPVNNS